MLDRAITRLPLTREEMWLFNEGMVILTDWLGPLLYHGDPNKQS